VEAVFVALVEPQGDLDGREDRDADDAGVEPVPPPQVPSDLDHALKVAQAPAARIGRRDEARIVLEDDDESGVRPTFSSSRPETMVELISTKGIPK
jgi:hypothetical protein